MSCASSVFMQYSSIWGCGSLWVGSVGFLLLCYYSKNNSGAIFFLLLPSCPAVLSTGEGGDGCVVETSGGGILSSRVVIYFSHLSSLLRVQETSYVYFTRGYTPKGWFRMLSKHFTHADCLISAFILISHFNKCFYKRSGELNGIHSLFFCL